MYDLEFQYIYIYFPQCECSFDYNDLQFHIMGHLMKCNALFLHQHLIKYINKYPEAVQYVGKTFLNGKGQKLQDYTAYMQQPGNRGDELSLYICARMCTKHIAVITKTSESPHRTPHTRSMGSPQVLETEPALQTTLPATPCKPHHQRKPKHFVVKEKVYKIRQGARHTCKHCSFCHEKFESQKELNSHVLGVHSFHFLCKRRTCGKFSSKAALVKHGLCHQLPRYRCTICGTWFRFQYQLKGHSNTHTPIFR